LILSTLTSFFFSGLFSYGWASLLLIFNVWFHTYDIVIVFGQLFATKALLKLVRHIVMRPISFPLPPSFVVHTPTPEQTRTLTVVLESQSSLLKLFAFTDLRRIAWTDRNRRLEVFSLSQPGGHPRNWTNISSACINVLEPYLVQNVSSRLESYGMDKDRGDLSDDDFAEVDREMLMMPHKSRKQRERAEYVFGLYLLAVAGRCTCQHSSLTERPEVIHRSRRYGRLGWQKIQAGNLRDSQHRFRLRYHTPFRPNIHEDRYGVVLKDLPGIIGVLVQLIQTIDKYFRLKAVSAKVKLIDATLQAALLRISGKFGEHFKALDLSREQLQTIKMVCQSDI
uniref:Nucleoporin NDC1 n=1 Tax=Heligmosomoides polygyrus TaxID=6339 RepID=A0A8L8KEA6_HELPZ